MAVRYGVPMSEFWSMTPKQIEPWRRFFLWKQQLDRDERDYQAWLNGQYVLAAIAAAFDSKKNPYPEEPVTVTSMRDEEIEQERRDKEAAEMFMAYAMEYNRRRHKNDGEGGDLIGRRGN